jgi:hypothetical protein
MRTYAEPADFSDDRRASQDDRRAGQDSALVPRLLMPLYLYTIVGAGFFGIWMLVAPATVAAAFGLGTFEPYLLGIVGAVNAAFAAIAALGLRAPLRFAPIFLVQLAYKSLWLALVFLPHLVRGAVPLHGWILALVFASYVVLDVLAIPFRMLARRQSPRADY